MSLITHLTSTKQLETLISSKGDKVIIIDFHATWCGPCHAVAPTYEKLSAQYRNVTFTKVDVDAAKEIAALYSVRVMPTFVLLRGGKKVDEIKGANVTAIEAALKRHTGGGGATGSTFPGAGHTLSGTSSSSSTTSLPGNANFPDVRLVLVVAAFVGLWWYYSKNSDTYVPELSEGLY